MPRYRALDGAELEDRARRVPDAGTVHEEPLAASSWTDKPAAHRSERIQPINSSEEEQDTPSRHRPNEACNIRQYTLYRVTKHAPKMRPALILPITLRLARVQMTRGVMRFSAFCMRKNAAF